LTAQLAAKLFDCEHEPIDLILTYDSNRTGQRCHDPDRGSGGGLAAECAGEGGGECGPVGKRAMGHGLSR
jgi:hypothetical protein